MSAPTSWVERMRAGRELSVEDRRPTDTRQTQTLTKGSTPLTATSSSSLATPSRRRGHFGAFPGEEGSYEASDAKDLSKHHGYAWDEVGAGEGGTKSLTERDVTLLQEVLKEAKAVFWDPVHRGRMGGVDMAKGPPLDLSDEGLRTRFRLVVADVLTDESKAYVKREVESFGLTDVRVGVKKTMASLVDFTTRMVHGMKCYKCKVEKRARAAGAEPNLAEVNTAVRLHGLGAACASTVHLAGSVQANVAFRLWQLTEIGSLGGYNVYEDALSNQRIHAHHDLPTLKVTLSLVPLDDGEVGYQVGCGSEEGLSESPSASRSASRRVGSSSVDVRVAQKASQEELTRAFTDLSERHEEATGTPFVGVGRGLPDGVYELPEGALHGATQLRVVGAAVSRPKRRDPSMFLPPPGCSVFDRMSEKPSTCSKQ